MQTETATRSKHKVKGDPDSSKLLTVKEVANILRVDDTTVRRWAKQGALEVVVLPHVNKRVAYRIRRETVEKLLDPTTR